MKLKPASLEFQTDYYAHNADMMSVHARFYRLRLEDGRQIDGVLVNRRATTAVPYSHGVPIALPEKETRKLIDAVNEIIANPPDSAAYRDDELIDAVKEFLANPDDGI